MATRHDKYYFEDGNVVFQVGEALFRIDKRPLVRSESSAFASMFSLPQTQSIEGQTDKRPIVLKGDSTEEFEALMRILYPPILDNPLDIPIDIYVQAMRIAIKYSMDDVQLAIARVIQPISPRPPCIGRAIGQLAFIAEFPSHISNGIATQVFTEASSIDFYPTADELKPLMAFPAFVALMVKYREGLKNPVKAIWQEDGYWDEGYLVEMDESTWLNTQFETFGFKPHA